MTEHGLNLDQQFSFANLSACGKWTQLINYFSSLVTTQTASTSDSSYHAIFVQSFFYFILNSALRV